ncbi:MAG: PIN domain-containing protein [Tildeniella nuda ZEHNDER 1965/U140]|jgi:predicted nucleic acid-binding protein|nr:PIN domain-containing protein [Tildeniella nuda ZEHNDER 1965/U140]
MKLLFADTFYWAALLNVRDAWHRQAVVYSQPLKQVQIVTTDEVLLEFLNFFSSYGDYMRSGAAQRVQDVLQNNSVRVVDQTHQSFLDGLALYAQRLDKGYSVTDCISMNTMRQLGIVEILTHDRHFTQESFTILFSEEA